MQANGGIRIRMSHSAETNDALDRQLPTRAEQVRAVIDALLQRRATGDTISHEALLTEHADLLPELADELRKLDVIDRARLEPIEEPASEHLIGPDDFGVDLEQTTPDSCDNSTTLYIRCPHCQQAAPGDSSEAVGQRRCPKCGKQFSLVDRQRGATPRSIGRFELIEQLGMGSFGTVWRARDGQLGREVAVKIPRRKQLDLLEIEEVMREARVTAKLNHPSIVRVHEVGREDDSVYIVSNLISGAPLHEARAKKPLSFEQTASLCQKVATALHHAHGQGVIHRDLKPANIMIDERGEPHLTDFGLAKQVSDEISMTMDGHILGTPAYMSPEQARRRRQPLRPSERRLFVGRHSL